MKCPHCGKNTKVTANSRAERTAALVEFLTEEFTARNILTKDCPAQDIAELGKLCLDKDLQASTTGRKDRIFSLFKHLHAFSEGLRPYGPQSRRAGYYRVWMTTRYGIGKAAELTNKADELYKELCK